jgi:hypothetical protein
MLVTAIAVANYGVLVWVLALGKGPIPHNYNQWVWSDQLGILPPTSPKDENVSSLKITFPLRFPKF